MRWMDTPIGRLCIGGGEDAVYFVSFDVIEDTAVPSSKPLEDAEKQLKAYFEGELRTFDLPLMPVGTDFQQRVWLALQSIPYGKTQSYKALSHQLGDDNLTRAVGNANGRNPVAIIIPCHRVIGSDHSLTGYASGLWRKRWLLEHEQKLAAGLLTLF